MAEPLLDLLVYYHQNSELMPSFQNEPDPAMDRFGLSQPEKAAIRAALDGHYEPLDGLLRELLPVDQFPENSEGWRNFMVFW